MTPRMLIFFTMTFKDSKTWNQTDNGFGWFEGFGSAPLATAKILAFDSIMNACSRFPSSLSTRFQCIQVIFPAKIA